MEEREQILLRERTCGETVLVNCSFEQVAAIAWVLGRWTSDIEILPLSDADDDTEQIIL